MRHLLAVRDLSPADIADIFELAERYAVGAGPSRPGAAVLFLPDTSLRTRVTLERAARLVGLDPILFPPQVLDRREDPVDVTAYLAQWSDVIVARHPTQATLATLAATDRLPVVNAMSDHGHPCEILADLFALSRRREDWRDLRYCFVGADGNIGRSWVEAATVLGLDLVQACPPGLELDGVIAHHCVTDAVRGADVVLTDPPGPHAARLAPFTVTLDLLASAAPGALLNPCPPFERGREVGADAIDSAHFVGHSFKQALLPVQQAVLGWVLAAGGV